MEKKTIILSQSKLNLLTDKVNSLEKILDSTNKNNLIAKIEILLQKYHKENINILNNINNEIKNIKNKLNEFESEEA